MKISLENYLRNELDKVESMHSFELATEAVRCWIDEYIEQLRQCNVSGQGESLVIVRSFTENDLKSFIIKLRRKHRKVEEEQIFCQQHNFKLEAQSKQNEADIIRRIIHEMENEFDLGFVWDKSLD